MFQSYVAAAIRSLKKNPGFTLLNGIGLALGITCSVLILTYVSHERSYDQFHEDADRIARVYIQTTLGAAPRYSEHSASPLADFLVDTVPEIEDAARVLGSVNTSLVQHNDVANYEENIVAADPAFFRLFDFELVRGNTETALATPYTVVLTPGFAARYFGSDDPIGKTLDMEFWGRPFEFTVTGIIGDAPSTSHIQYDAVMSYATYLQYQIDTNGTDISQLWTMTNPTTYVLMHREADWRALDRTVTEAVLNLATTGPDAQDPDDVWYRYHVQPLTDVHLGALGLPIEAPASARTLSIFALIALLILLIACVNYMNLATARATQRAREVGVRKAIGAHRRQLIGQFMTEALLLSLAAAAVAVLLIKSAAPLFATLTGNAEMVTALARPGTLLLVAGAALVAGLIAGIYPALMLTSFRPAAVLRGTSRGGTGHAKVRRGLVVLQFATGIALIITTLAVNQQLQFVTSTNLGFDSEQVVAIPLRGSDATADGPLLKSEIARLPGVVSVALGGALPDRITSGNGVGVVGAPDEEMTIRRVVAADPDYREVLDFEVVAGRWFDTENPTDTDAYVINESAVRDLQIDDPLTSQLNRNGNVGPVIGVVRDFHFESLHRPIQPLIIHAPRANYHNRYVVARLAAGSTQDALRSIEAVWNSVEEGLPFSYSFLDERLDQLYETEQRQGRLFGVFAALGIIVACLGLFGLAAFTAEQRTKEIGIRKVLGASVSSITALLSKDFVVLVAVAFVIAAPVAALSMQRWLERFAYHIDLKPGLFLVAAAIGLGVALLTVGWQSVRTALANPITSLRHE